MRVFAYIVNCLFLGLVIGGILSQFPAPGIPLILAIAFILYPIINILALYSAGKAPSGG